MADVSTYKVYGTLPTIGEEQVKKLIEQSESGALPEVTADDNGKVLTVVEGEWDKAEAGGGGGILVVHVNEETGALDKTWQEIYDAGFCVMERYFEEEGTTSKGYLTISGIGFEGDEFFGGFFYADGVIPFLADSADGYPVLNQNGGDGN